MVSEVILTKNDKPCDQEVPKRINTGARTPQRNYENQREAFKLMLGGETSEKQILRLRANSLTESLKMRGNTFKLV